MLVQVVVLVATLGSPGGPCPIVEQTGSGFALRLPTTFQHCLLEAAPGFRPWSLADYSEDIRTGYRFSLRQTPWAVTGDFNGDGWCDLVIDGHVATRSCRLVVWGGTKPTASAIETSALSPGVPLSSALEFCRPGHIESNFSDDSMDLFTDGFSDNDWQEAAVLHFWRNGHFEDFQTDD